MKKKLLFTYSKIFSSCAKFILLILLCLALSFLVIYPIWFFALKSPVTYSFVALTLLAFFILFSFYKAIKKSDKKTVISNLLKVAIILLAICLCVVFVFSGKRFLSIPTIIIAFALYGVSSYFVKGNDKK